MSVTRTYTVTVANPGSGNRYYIDGNLQETLYLAESGTYKFDQSDSSNNNHPLRFSTTSNGNHSGGDEYTTGVTTNGTPGNSGAYTQIVVADSAPTLYYYCTNHSGMGGTANTPTADTWGALGWNTNRWGTDEAFSLGWGAQAWNDSEWGELNDAVISLTSPGSITSAIGSVSVSAQIAVGWGQDGWGVENWGESGLVVELEAPNAVTTTVGCGSSWNQGTYGQQGWGVFVLETADVIGLTGVASTASVGSPTIIGNATFSLTGVSSTTNVGSISPADVMGLSGISSTSAVGTIQIASNPVVAISGVQITSAVGAIDPSAQVVGITGVSFTASVGSLVPADVIGLTGQEFTASVAAFGTSTGFGIQAYQSVDTGSNISYSDVATGTNITYKDVA